MQWCLRALSSVYEKGEVLKRSRRYSTDNTKIGKLCLCEDLNGHIGRRENDEKMLNRDRCNEFEMIIQNAKAFDLNILNTFFNRLDKKLVIYNSGKNKRQRLHFKQITPFSEGTKL